MSTQNPQNPSNHDKDEPSVGADVDRSDALKKAIQKLREQGKLKHVPESLLPDSPDSETEVTAQAPETDGSTTESVLREAQERAAWAAVMAGWDLPSPPLTKPEPPSAVTPDNQFDDVVAITPEPIEPPEPAVPHTPEPPLVAIVEMESPAEIVEPIDKAVVLTRKQITPSEEEDHPPLVSKNGQTPWTLQQFFDGEIDLDVELSKRFPAMPMIVSAKFRTLGSQSARRVATLETADGGASLIIDADLKSKEIRLSFTFGSMMTLKYALSTLNGTDRSRWLELMRRDQGGLAFLWGPARWQEDYMICIARKYVTNIYAFSPNNFESALRLTPQVTQQLLDWLDEIWNAPDEEPDSDAPLLTW